MTIADMHLQDKIPKSLLVIVAILLAGAAGIGIGLLIARDMAQTAAGKADTAWIEQLPPEELPGSASTTTTQAKATKPQVSGSQNQAAAAAALPAVGEVIASKTGTVYYLPTCSGVSRIKPENRVTYASASAAQAKGLAPAKNCKGL
jgi:hypothetical protein